LADIFAACTKSRWAIGWYSS